MSIASNPESAANRAALTKLSWILFRSSSVRIYGSVLKNIINHSYLEFGLTFRFAIPSGMC